jgi:DNA-directed RNA polymerase specialized sigma24 family protein
MAGDTQSSDDERLTRLFKSEYNSVLAYCVRRVGFDDAEDVAAQVFAVAWRRIDEIRPADKQGTSR